MATQSHKHQVVGAKRDRPNTKPGNWAINIYTLRLGFAHPAASGARPATEVQVLTVLLVVVQDFQPDHNPHCLSVLGQIHSQGGQEMLLFPAQGASASCSDSGLSAAVDFGGAHRSPGQQNLSAQPALCCCGHDCFNAIWAQLPDPQLGSPPWGNEIQSCEHC